MKYKAVILLATAPVLIAGTPQDVPAPTPENQWITPTIDVRARYEYADIDGKDQSNAFTFRERVGLKTKEWNGFSALIEGEFSQAACDDYNGGAREADPFDPANSLIADPETNELNQALVQYSGFDSIGKVGRQRIIYDNAAFIGNVGWRQNEQTFDAITLSNKHIDGLTLNYAYIDQVNRIFGSEADAPLNNNPTPLLYDNVQYLDANLNLFNASYTGIKGVTLGAYAYIMDFADKPNWANNTFGVSAKGDAFGLTFYGEVAYQDQSGFYAEDNAFYAHGKVTKAFGKQSVTLGIEALGAGFKTPLATAHAFNGYADAFVSGRLEGNHNGLTDVQLSHTMPLFWGLKWTNVLHAFGDNQISDGYGWEYDSVLVKKFDDHFSALAKVAQFESEGDVFVNNKKNAGLPTTTRFSVELDYTF